MSTTGSPTTVLRCAVALLAGAAAVGGLLACGDSGSSASPTPTQTAASADPDFQRRAQQHAFEAIQPKVETMLAAADPLSAHALGRGPLRPAPLARTTADDALERTWKDLRELEVRFLEPRQAAVLRAMTMAIERRRHIVRRPPPWRSDPAWVIHDLKRTWATALDARATRDLERASELVPSMARHLTTGAKSLGATAPAALRGARADLDALHRDVLEHAEFAQPSALAAWAEAVRETHEHFTAIEEALPESSAALYGDPIRPANTPAAVRRLPDRWGAAELQRSLDDEEHMARSAEELFVALGPTIAQLQMRAAGSEGEAEASRPVDALRCSLFEAAFGGLRARQPLLFRAWLDCATAVRRWNDQPLSDAAFALAALEHAVIVPLRQERRSSELPVLGLIHGRIAPASQRLSQRVALAAALEDPAASRRAAQEALHAACASAAALWVHGELGSDADLEARLGPRCGNDTPWITYAVEHPRTALDGLELWRLGHGPAEAVALDRFWWMPAGLIDPLMQPTSMQPPSTPVTLRTEELHP